MAFRSTFAALFLAAAVVTAARAETLTLADCLRETAERNPQIIRQRFAIEEATAQRLTLRARALPLLNIGGVAGILNREDTGRRETVFNPATGKTETRETATTQESKLIALGTGILFQPLFDAAIPASYRRGTAQVLAEQENFYVVASTQLHNARLLFYQALYHQLNGGLLRQTDEVFATNVKTVEQLAGAGLAGRGPLLSARVQRTNFGPELERASGTYRTSLAQLLQLMGRDPGKAALDAITLAGALDAEAPAFDPAEAVRLALDRRPDLRTLREMARVYTEDANIARAGYYPLVRLYVAGTLVPESNVRSNTPNAVRESDTVQTTEVRPGVRAEWTVIDTGNVRGAVARQNALRDEVGITVRRLEANLPAELSIVRARLGDASSRIAALGGNVDIAQNTLNMIQAGVAQGVNSQLEFLDAQNGLLATRSGLLQAKLEMSLARADFDRVTGNYLRYVVDGPVTAQAAPAAKKKPSK